MDRYICDDMLYSILATNDVLLFSPPWPFLRHKRRQKSLYTEMLYRIGFRRRDTDQSSPSLNSQWAPLTIFHNSCLPNKELCIIHMPQRPMVVTYLEVLHKPTLNLHSFLHIPDIPVTTNGTYTPFPAVEKERSFTGKTIVTAGRFDIAKAVDADICARMANEVISTAASTDSTVWPLQGTIDGYFWKSLQHWLTVAPRLKQFNEEDCVYVLTDVVLQIRNIVRGAFCLMAVATDTICEVFFRPATSSVHLNERMLDRLFLADMQSLTCHANKSLTLKALMCTNMCPKTETSEKEIHPLPLLVSDPWLLFALRNFVPKDSFLFSLLQNSKKIEPVDRPIVFTVHETYAGATAAELEHVRLWTNTPVDVETDDFGQEGIQKITITSPIVVQMDTDGTLGRNVRESGGISSIHGQSQHTTSVFLTPHSAYIYDDTIPFLIKACRWDNNELRSKLDSPLHMLKRLLTDSHSYCDEYTEEVL